jgi:hypothetical protein
LRITEDVAMRWTLLALLLGCNDGEKVPGGTTEADADTDADTDTDTDTDADTDAEPPAEPCFEEDIVPIFERSCGTGDDSCHSPVAFGPSAASNCEGWLSLVDGPLGSDDCAPLPLYERLTQLHGWSCLVNGAPESGYAPLVWNYVTPFDPAQSVLYQKVAPDGVLCAQEAGVLTQRMPVGAPLPAADVALIREWILQGARAGAACDEGTTPPPNDVPVVVITHPGDGEVRFASNGAFPFIATATDTEDGDLTASIAWSSSLAGAFGVGSGFDWLPTPEGFHVITASVTDSGGAVGEASITVEMRP